MANQPALPNTLRFFVAGAQIAQGHTTDGDLIHQWVRVLRMRVGQELLLIDADSQSAWRVELTAIGKNRVDWHVRTVDPVLGEPALQVTLAVGVMRAQQLAVLTVGADGAVTGRVTATLPAARYRGLTLGGDGALWVVTDAGELWRVTPGAP